MPEYIFKLPLIPKEKKKAIFAYLEDNYVLSDYGCGKLYFVNRRESGKLLGIETTFRREYQSPIIANRDLLEIIQYLDDQGIENASETICAQFEA